MFFVRTKRKRCLVMEKKIQDTNLDFLPSSLNQGLASAVVFIQVRGE